MKTLSANNSWHLKLFKLTFPFWAWVIQVPSSMQHTLATIYQHIQLKSLSILALCTKFELISIKTWEHLHWWFFSSFIHSLKTISTNRVRNFDSSPDCATFFEQNQCLVEKLYFWELRNFEESLKLLKSNMFLSILTRINCFGDFL